MLIRVVLAILGAALAIVAGVAILAVAAVALIILYVIQRLRGGKPPIIRFGTPFQQRPSPPPADDVIDISATEPPPGKNLPP